MTNENDKKVVEKIRSNYSTDSKQPTKLQELKALDKKVKIPARVFAYIFGTIGALILGVGMCLAMEVIGDAMVAGIIGIVGIAMVSLAYPLYQNYLISVKHYILKRLLPKATNC